MDGLSDLRGIVCQVQKETHVLHGAVFLEILLEETSRLHVDSHGSKNDGKVVVVVVQHTLAWQLDQPTLSTDLRSNLVVRQTGRRKDGNLLPTSNTVHHVDGGNARLHHFLGVDTRPGIDWLTCKEMVQKFGR